MQKLPSASPPSPRAKVGELLLWLSDEVIEITNEELNRKNISISKLGILLLFLREDLSEEALRPSAIAERLRITRASVTNHLNWLEHQGYIQRRKLGKDQRNVDVQITEKGNTFLKEVLPAFWGVCADFSKTLTDDEVATMLTLLSKIHDTID